MAMWLFNNIQQNYMKLEWNVNFDVLTIISNYYESISLIEIWENLAISPCIHDMSSDKLRNSLDSVCGCIQYPDGWTQSDVLLKLAFGDQLFWKGSNESLNCEKRYPCQVQYKTTILVQPFILIVSSHKVQFLPKMLLQGFSPLLRLKVHKRFLDFHITQ